MAVVVTAPSAMVVAHTVALVTALDIASPGTAEPVMLSVGMAPPHMEEPPHMVHPPRMVHPVTGQLLTELVLQGMERSVTGLVLLDMEWPAMAPLVVPAERAKSSK
jgi:hypothetical protein